MAEDDPSANQQSQSEASPDQAGQGDAVSQQLSQTQATVDQLQAQVDSADESASPWPPSDPASTSHGGDAVASDIELLGDVDLDVSIELGRTEMLVEDVLKLGTGSVVELDKLAGDPVDVYVNGRLVARGEVLVLNDNFCIRISEIVANLEEQAQVAAAEQGNDG